MSRNARILAAIVLGAAAVVAAGTLPGTLAAAAVAVLVLLLVLVGPPRSEPPARAAEGRDGREDAPQAIEPVRELVSMLDVLNEGVLLLGERQVVLAANQSAARIVGRPRDRMVGVSLMRAARDHELVQLLRESTGQLREITVGDGRIILASATPLEFDAIRTLLTMQDVTALRRAERARQDLVANVSHELRTPIAAALALAETLEAGVDDPEHRERFVQRLTTEIERLRDIVERLLQLSRIESREEEFHIETLAVDELLRDAVERMAPVAERSSAAVVTDLSVEGVEVRADRERVVEVLTNLLDNAIRFSPPGGTVRLAVEPERSMARLCVSDEGPGIMPADRLRVFERFYTGERSRSPEGRGGTGLGLAIARHIVSRLGGEIWVGDGARGATLCFTLPLAGAPPPAAAAAGARAAQRRRRGRRAAE